MAKGNANPSRGVPNKHLHARVAYLQQAATHLALAQVPENVDGKRHQLDHDTALHGLPLLLASQLKAVSLKAQIRLSRDMKRSFCKTCNAPLLPNTVSETRVENMSRGANKPCADVLVVTCRGCKTQKRFPVGAQRQKKKAARKAASQVSPTHEDQAQVSPTHERQVQVSATPVLDGAAGQTHQTQDRMEED